MDYDSKVTIVLGLLGIIGSLAMIKYREAVGNMIGEADWMLKVGGVYMVIIYIALFFFFWSVAYMTGTTGFFFGWVKLLIPGLQPAAQPQPMM